MGAMTQGLLPEPPAFKDYLLQFFAQIIPAKRIGTNLPEVIWFDKIVRVPSKKALDLEVNKEAAFIIIKQRGMIVLKNQILGHIQIGDDESFIGRRFVPMDMFAEVWCEVKEIVGETPNHLEGETFTGEGDDKKLVQPN